MADPLPRSHLAEARSRRALVQVDTNAAQAADWLAGGGEMGSRVRAFDWSRTPLGPRESWSQSLRTAVRIVLDCRYPMWVWWGPQLINIHNDAFVPILGGRHPGALGRPGAELWADIWDDISPLIERAREGTACFGEDRLYALERDGEREERYFTFSYSPVPDDDGSVGGVLCPVIEQTERVLSERRMRTLRELSARTAEESRTAEQACQTAAQILARNPHDLPFALIYLLDGGGPPQPRVARLAGTVGLVPGSPAAPEAVALDTAEAKNTGWPLAQVAASGRPQVVDDLAARFGRLPGGMWPEPPARALVLPVLRSGREQVAGFLVAGVSSRRALDEHYIDFFALLANHIGTAMANAHAIQDERRRAEALAELDRAKTAFFSNVSHELRTPLTLILGPTEDALASGRALHGEDLRAVYRNELRLLKLVNALLDFARMESGRAQPTFQPTDVAALTGDLASTFRAAIERAGLRFEVDCPPLSGPVYLDRRLWEQVVLNLLSNAFNFTLDGSIAVRLRADDSQFQLQVSDTGAGIPAAELGRVFERFHRVEGARSRTHEGSGIGLALVQEIVRLHGGRIEAASEVDRGTTFTVHLPRGKEHLPPESVAPSGARPGSAALAAAPYLQEALRWNAVVEPPRRPEELTPAPLAPGPEATVRGRLLVVDDNSDMRDYLQRLLEPRYQVDTAADGREALELARARPPDVVVTDVMMPNLGGFGLLRELREDPRLRDLSVLMLTARADEEPRLLALQTGADDYLVKPFSARELLARVDLQMRLRRLRVEADAERQLLYSLFAKAPFMASIYEGPELRLVFQNDAARRLLNRPEALGKPLVEGFPEFAGQPDAVEFERVYRTGQPSLEKLSKVFLRRPGGELEERYFLTSRQALRDEGAQIDRVISVAVEVTDQVLSNRKVEAARAEAEAANRTKDEFLAMLGHELRNPLTPILATTELMRLQGGRKFARERDLIERQAQQLARLVDDLLDVARIAQGKAELSPKPVDLGAIVHRAVEVASPLLEERGHHLRIDVPPGLVLNADEGRLVQVVSNLLTNAAKYTQKHGRIQVLAERDGSSALLRVLDNGIGLHPDLLPRVFDRFTQGVRKSDRTDGGLGLGLSIVRNLVELHGGTVGAFSAGSGKGSEFVVRLPLARRARARARPPAQAKLKPVAKPRAILIVDDNRDIADVLAQLLRTRGHTVQVAYDAAAALALVEQFRPQFALLDIGLPAMDGYELAVRLRKRRGLSRMVLLAVTGYGQLSDRRRARRAGFAEHLTKPIDLPRLLSLIEGG